MPKFWTAADEQLLRANYAKVPMSKLAKQLNCTVIAMRSKARMLKITRGSRKMWTAEEDEYIREKYADTKTTVMAEHLKRTVGMVYQRADKLGLEKSEAYKKDPANNWGIKKGSGIGEEYRFKKGQTPPNKGLRRPGWAPGRMAETQFKKGMLNGTAKELHRPIGTILADNEGYLRIKVREHDDNTRGWHKDVWPLLHHKVWKDAGREIPAGHVLIFKDKNRANCDIDNLELISQADNMRRNSFRTNYPPELVQLVQLTGAIKRQINKKERQQNATN